MCVCNFVRRMLEEQSKFSKSSENFEAYSFPVTDSVLFMQRISEFVLSDTSSATYEDYIGFDNVSNPSKVVFVSFQFYSLIPVYSSGFDIYDNYTLWQDAVDYLNDIGPITANNVFQSCSQWVSMWTDVIAVTGTLYSIVIVSIVALVTMLIFTSSVILSLVGIVCIILALIVILGVFWLIGWSLGIVEAIGISILLGAAVDYPLHVIESFLEQTQHYSRIFYHRQPSLASWPCCNNMSGRRARQYAVQSNNSAVTRAAYLGKFTTQSIVAIGPSIINSAFTTAGCVAFLFLCKVEIFVKVNAIFSSRIVYRIFFSKKPCQSVASF